MNILLLAKLKVGVRSSLEVIYLTVLIRLTKLHNAVSFHKSNRHILVSKDELILIVSGTLLQILGAIYDTVLVPYV